ncbi:hypothetical protein [Pedobacter borealis]|uniref:hypothetical protein n=1 Tax=Pedobacter borealis TaxID=475254 RepID=UPI0012F91E12|nr:hypothetical protein [Pedobacter borealis]
MEKYQAIFDANKVRTQLEESDAMVTWKKFQQGRSSYLIFLDNSKTVRQSIRKLNSIPMGHLDNDQRWRLQRTIVKDLHNIISSGQNFLDHLKHSHNFNESVHDKEYSIFFRELRNYLVHNDAFSLVTRNEYGNGHAPKFYQAMDKTGFKSFVNNKATKIYDKVQTEPTKVSKREGELLSELFTLLNFLDEKETLFDFEPILEKYILSLNAYYSKWVLSVLKKKVKLSEITKFTEDMETVHKHFPNSYSKSRVRYLKLAVAKKRTRIPPDTGKKKS